MTEDGVPTPFLLSHHRPDEYHRCVRVGPWRLCARCLGVYPVLFAALAAQIARRAPLHWALDAAWAALLPIPALVDWARSRFDPSRGTNAGRMLTGALLGASLARTLYLHLRRPGHPVAAAQLAGLVLVVVAVEIAAWRFRTRRADPRDASRVQALDSDREP